VKTLNPESTFQNQTQNNLT